MKLRLAGKCNIDSIVDGPGLRMVVWTQGCTHNCFNCHNPQTHDVNGGSLVDTSEIIQLMDETHLQAGITLSGGEPFDQAEPLIEIAAHAKQINLNVWAYTGYRFEDLLKNETQRELLNHVDVLVDGKFIDAKRHYEIKFKGSLNQRIIDVQASLVAGEVILSRYDDDNLKINIEK